MCPRFSTYLLDEVVERKRKDREKFRLHLIEKLFDTLRKLRVEVSFHEAYLFGSISRPYKFSGTSDIDIGFTGLKAEDFFKAMSFISREIGRDVDVVQLEGHRLAEKIKRDGIKWTAKD
jgi:predicted nucleotidyltransferase